MLKGVKRAVLMTFMTFMTLLTDLILFKGCFGEVWSNGIKRC